MTDQVWVWINVSLWRGHLVLKILKPFLDYAVKQQRFLTDDPRPSTLLYLSDV